MTIAVPERVRDRGIGGGFGHFHGLATGERVVHRRDEHVLGRKDRTELELGRGSLHRREDHVDFVPSKPTHPPGGVGDLHVYPDTGMALPKAPEESREDGGRHRLFGREAEIARRDAASPFGKGDRETIETLHQRCGKPIETLAGRGQGDARTASLEQ